MLKHVHSSASSGHAFVGCRPGSSSDVFIYLLGVPITENPLLKSIQQWKRFCSCWINGKTSVHLSKTPGKYRTPYFCRYTGSCFGIFGICTPLCVSTWESSKNMKQDLSTKQFSIINLIFRAEIHFFQIGLWRNFIWEFSDWMQINYFLKKRPVSVNYK